MELPSNLLLPAILVATIGFIVGGLVAVLVLDRLRATEKSEPPPEQPSPGTQPASAEPHTGLPLERFEPLVRLYREKVSGKIVTEVDRKIYLTPDTVPVEILTNLRTAAESWNLWLGLPPLTQQQPPVAANQESFIPQASLIPEPAILAAVGKKPRGSNMVEQIDDLIQTMLPDSNLAGRVIRLKQEPSLGVVVWVDAQKYIGIDFVPDPEVQVLVRAAVKKWEDAIDPGVR